MEMEVEGSEWDEGGSQVEPCASDCTVWQSQGERELQSHDFHRSCHALVRRAIQRPPWTTYLREDPPNRLRVDDE